MDVDEICSLDTLAGTDEHRRQLIVRSVVAGNCFVAIDVPIWGHGVPEHTFNDYVFVSMLVVRPESRRPGVGTALMKHFEFVCHTGKLFAMALEQQTQDRHPKECQYSQEIGRTC